MSGGRVGHFLLSTNSLSFGGKSLILAIGQKPESRDGLWKSTILGATKAIMPRIYLIPNLLKAFFVLLTMFYGCASAQDVSPPDLGNRVTTMSFSSDGILVAAGLTLVGKGETPGLPYDGEVHIIGASDGKKVQSIRSLGGEVVAALFSHDNMSVVTAIRVGKKAGNTYSFQSKLCFYDVASGKLLKQLPYEYGVVTCMAISPDGKTITIGDASGHVSFFDAVSGKTSREPLVYPKSQVQALQYSAMNNTLLVGLSRSLRYSMFRSEIKLLDAENFSEKRMVKTVGFLWSALLADDDSAIVAHTIVDHIQLGAGQSRTSDVPLQVAAAPQMLIWPRHWMVFPNVAGDRINFAGIDALPGKLEWDGKSAIGQSVTSQEGRIDIAPLGGGVGERKEAILFAEIESPRAQTVQIGASADWYMEWFVNGQKAYSTLESGNVGAQSLTSHVFPVALRAGKNLVAVRVQSGSRGWNFLSGGPLQDDQLINGILRFWRPKGNVFEPSGLPKANFLLSPINRMAASINGKTVVTVGDGRNIERNWNLVVWDTKTQSPKYGYIFDFRDGSSVTSIAVDHSGNLVACATGPSAITIWDGVTKKFVVVDF